MSLIAGLAIGPQAADELKRVVDAVSDNDLRELAHVDPAFKVGGFRADRPAQLRARLLQLACAAPPLSDMARRTLARHSLNAGLVASFSLSLLSEHRSDLEALFGAQRLVVAVILDDRPEVRELGARWVRSAERAPSQEGEPQSVPSVPVSDAAQHVRERLAPLLVRLSEAGQIASSEVPGSASQASSGTMADPRTVDELRERLREAQAECRRLRSVEERGRRLAEKLEQSKTEASELRKKLDDLEAELRKLKASEARLRQDLDLQQRNTSALVGAAVEVRVAEEFHGWLARARAIEACAESVGGGKDGSGDLLDRAVRAMASQEAADRLSGNRAELRRRLDAVSEKLDLVRDAAENAIRPLPEILAICGELAQEQQRLRGLLGIDDREARLASSFAVAAAGCPENRVAEMIDLASRLSSLGVLSAEDGDRVNEALRLRQSLLIAAADRHGPKEDKDGRPDDPVWRLDQALSSAETAILLVDGHNVLFSLQARYRTAPDDRQGFGAAARDALVADLVKMSGNRPTLRVWIVFDGPQASDRTASENVRVSFSGGEGTDRADALLRANVRFFRQAGAGSVLLATNDGALAAEARRQGALVLPPGELTARFAAGGRRV
jgi:predicted RNA-binding protein with PIN domain